MGKASRQLSEARSEISKEMGENKIEENNGTNNIKHECFNDKFTDTIRQEMIEYCDKNSYALCEYLDVENLSNFIFWLQNR